MNNYQYAADKYIALHAHWNGKGLLFNLIPGIRYTRLRELVELKVAYGGMNTSHTSVLPFLPITLPRSAAATLTRYVIELSSSSFSTTASKLLKSSELFLSAISLVLLSET
jgi:hypothetical protein